MSSIQVATAEEMSFFAGLDPVARAGLSDPRLVFHTPDNHLAPGFEFLQQQWAWYESHNVMLNRRATGAGFKIHDHRLAEQLDRTKHKSREHRSAEYAIPIFVEHSMEVDELELAVSSIIATNFSIELDPSRPNEIVVVQADLHNTWGPYAGMAANAHRVHQEDDNLDGKHMSFDDHKQKVEFVLGSYFERDMAIIDKDRLPCSGECIYNHDGRQNLKQYLNETPESLGELLGIDPRTIA